MLDFAELAGGDVVDEAADGYGGGNPRVGAEFLQLVADVFFDVLEGVEKGRGDGGRSGAILDSGAEILFVGVHEAAVGVVDDHEFLGAEEMVRNDEGAERVFSDDAAGVADDVGVAGFQPERADGKAGVHAGEDGEFTRRTRGECAEFVRARINFVGLQDFVDDGHGKRV
jgi:hypothetical protein